MFGFLKKKQLKADNTLVSPVSGGAFAAAVTYLTKLTAISFGTTGLPGIAIAAPGNNGYLNYIIVNLVGVLVGMFFTIIIGKFFIKNQAKAV